MANILASLHDRAESLAGNLPDLMIAADRVAATVSQGVHGRRRVGQGETFWQFRRYQWGDPVQKIDWRRSAKSDPVYLRETEWDLYRFPALSLGIVKSIPFQMRNST